MLTACASGSPTTTAMDQAVQAQLRQDLRALASAAAAHSTPSAQAALAALNADAAAAHAAGKLSDTRLAQIRAAAVSVQADLTPPSAPMPRATISVTPASSSPPARATPGGKHKGKGKGDGDAGGGD